MSFPRLAALSSIAVLTSALHAQGPANDWAGIQMRATGVSSPAGVASAILCGAPQSCTPLQMNALGGDSLSYLVMGTLQGFYVLAATLDVPSLLCIPLGIPGIANNLILPPGLIVTVAVGTCSVTDNGRCNGGFETAVLFQIPAGLPPGQVAFQAAVGSPLSAGGFGLAFSPAIVINYQ